MLPLAFLNAAAADTGQEASIFAIPASRAATVLANPMPLVLWGWKAQAFTWGNAACMEVKY